MSKFVLASSPKFSEFLNWFKITTLPNFWFAQTFDPKSSYKLTTNLPAQTFVVYGNNFALIITTENIFQTRSQSPQKCYQFSTKALPQSIVYLARLPAMIGSFATIQINRLWLADSYHNLGGTRRQVFILFPFLACYSVECQTKALVVIISHCIDIASSLNHFNFSSRG